MRISYERQQEKPVYKPVLGVAGATLAICAIAGVVDIYWNSVGMALLGVGGMQLWRQRRYRKDEAYREKMDTEMQDERNKFIANKAWAWAGYAFVMIAAVPPSPSRSQDAKI